MKYLIITLVLSFQLLANNLYWYSDNNKVKIYNTGYSNIHNSTIYSSSQNIKAKQMILTNNIILAFNKSIIDNNLNNILNKYNLKLIKRMNIGSGFYILECLDNNSLEIANIIYENEDNIKSSYPDWMYLK